MKKEFKEIYIYCFVIDSFGTLNYQEKYKTKLVYKDAYTSWYATEGKNGLCFPRQRNVQNFALDLRSMINYATDDLHHVWEGWESESRIASPFEFSEEEIKKYVDEYNRETIKTRIHYTVYSLQSSIEQYEIEIKKQTKKLTEIEEQIAKLEPLCKKMEDRW